MEVNSNSIKGSEEWFQEILIHSDRINYIIKGQSKAGLTVRNMSEFIPKQMDFVRKFAESEYSNDDQKKRLCDLIVSCFKTCKSYLKEHHINENTISAFDDFISETEEILL